MTTCDVEGRPYLKLSSASENMTVKLDEGFTCHGPGLVTYSKSNRGYISRAGKVAILLTANAMATSIVLAFIQSLP